jgi:phosphoribosylamine--glycine ligase
MQNVLILGSGGREHALAFKFQESPSVNKVYVMPGNDGIAQDYSCVSIRSFDKIYDFILENQIDLVFVGSEQYLADGIVDYLNQFDVAVIGPSKEAAQIESSKVFSKNLMLKYNIPTASYKTFCDAIQAIDYIKSQKFPLVIKADGLAAGKGVLIAQNEAEAAEYVVDILSGQKFGTAGNEIVLEEFLSGEEVSIFAFCDGKSFVSTIISQDHKKTFDNDEGLNTGGMGAYAPVDKFHHLKDRIDREIFTPVLKALSLENKPFKGILYAGLIIETTATKENNIRVIEFNARLGDPETQVILPLLENDIFEICKAIIEGTVNKVALKWKDKYAVNVVLASIGYPEDFEKGHLIQIPTEVSNTPNLHIYFSGVVIDSDGIKNSGGRVFSATAIDDTLESAIEYCYSKISLVKSDILRYRTDIAGKHS